MEFYAVALKGEYGFDHNTVVKLVSMDLEKGMATGKKLNSNDEVTIGLDHAIPCERVSKLKENIGKLKAGDLVYEVSFDSVTNEISGYDAKGHHVTVDVALLEDLNI